MNIEPLNPELKFNKCKFRSEQEEERLIKRCSCQGGDYTIKGYNCHAREIFQVTEDICEDCPIFEAK
jgi:hypothetical protein